jgi:nicotinate phosphoribosyltransferase
MADQHRLFDLFFRSIPETAAIDQAGVEQMIDYLKRSSLPREPRLLGVDRSVRRPFSYYLRHFKFACDIWAIPEGTPIFPTTDRQGPAP